MQTYSDTAAHAQANHRYQSDLALSLIENLGLEDAIEVCQRNFWSGIQDIILQERRRLAAE